MGEVIDYNSTLSPGVREVFEAIRRRALEIVPDAVEGRSYGMAALLYKGKGLISARQTAKHLAVYPFSGKVVSQVADRLAGFSLSSGTIRFQLDRPIPQDILDDILLLRVREIDSARSS